MISVILKGVDIYNFFRSNATDQQYVDVVNTIIENNRSQDIDNIVQYAQDVATGEKSISDDFYDGVDTIVDDSNTEDESSTAASDTSEDTQTSSNLVAVTVKRVVDGDTIVVTDQSGNEIRVRLIGVNSPESDTDAGKIAAEFTSEHLTAGMTVYLQYDTGMYDVYDRTLAYVWLSDKVDVSNTDDMVDYMYNTILLTNGQADVMTVEPNTLYKDIFEKLQELRDGK